MNSSCSGNCTAGYYCPSGSVSSVQETCGSPQFYCPQVCCCVASAYGVLAIGELRCKLCAVSCMSMYDHSPSRFHLSPCGYNLTGRSTSYGCSPWLFQRPGNGVAPAASMAKHVRPRILLPRGWLSVRMSCRRGGEYVRIVVPNLQRCLPPRVRAFCVLRLRSAKLVPVPGTLPPMSCHPRPLHSFHHFPTVLLVALRAPLLGGALVLGWGGGGYTVMCALASDVPWRYRCRPLTVFHLRLLPV
jgi:hypothetical protein